MKTLWIDTETLSLDENKPDIIRIAGIIEEDCKILDKFVIPMNPINVDLDSAEYNNVWEYHKKLSGLSKEEVKDFQPSNIGFSKLKSKLEGERYIIGGFNVNFDLQKIISLYKENFYKPSFITSIKIDPMYIIPYVIPQIPMDCLSLEKLWDFLWGFIKDKSKVEIDNKHTAKNNVTKTFLIWKFLLKPLQQSFLTQIY